MSNNAKWIKWDGGDQPVADGVLVDIRLKDGTYRHGKSPETRQWDHIDDPSDIAAYRLHNAFNLSEDVICLKEDVKALQAENECLRKQKSEILKGVAEFQQMANVADSKLKADAVREAADEARNAGYHRPYEFLIEYSAKLESGEV